MTSLIENELRQVGSRTRIPFAARFAGGGEYRSSRDKHPEFTLIFRHPRAYWRTAAFGHVGLLESYFDGDIDIEGSLARCLAAGMEGGLDQPRPLVTLRNRWHEFLYSNSNLWRARKNAEFHYAHSPEFYKLWLDDLMLYTCAYWRDGVRSLEEAQRDKLDHVARKLCLQPGDNVIDVGCGFGGFAIHAPTRYGVKVTAVNTTSSQVEYARGEAARRGVQGANIMVGDFREVQGEYDKVASIGCLEHAGRHQLGEVIRAHARVLKPGGFGLIHFIGHVGHHDTDYFIRKYVFPGGWIPSLADVIVEMEKAGLEVLDVENLRRHYALTLDAWAERFDRNWDRIKLLDPRKFDERFRRIWRVYLYGCAELFRAPEGITHLFQVVFSKGVTKRYPMTRDFLYEQPAPQSEKRSTSRAA